MKLYKIIYWSTIVSINLFLWCNYFIRSNYHDKLDKALEERIRLVDSVYKYRDNKDFINEHYYRKLHSEQTVLMLIYWDKLYNELPEHY